MIQIIFIAATFFILLCSELIYIPIARRRNWIAGRNNRPDRQYATVTGGGIIFYLAMILWSLGIGWIYYPQNAMPYFLIGLTILAACSFLDDILQLQVGIRLIVQIIAAIFMCFQINVFLFNPWAAGLFIIWTVGFINGYNFMDGINGITGLYSLSLIGLFWWLNFYQSRFISGTFLFFSAMAVAIFLFFNLRKRAIVFAGDVGSICMGYIINTALTLYILHTHDYTAVIFVIVYCTDIFMTIFRRIFEHENILMPHHKHIYQGLTRVYQLPQLWVSVIYTGLQTAISITYLLIPAEYRIIFFICTAGILATTYIVLMLLIEQRKAYLKQNNQPDFEQTIRK